MHANIDKLGEMRVVKGIGDAEREESCAISSVCNKT